MQNFDVVVIGTGTAGQTCAYDLLAEGMSVAVIESSVTPGGICALHGCQAKKWFYEVAELMGKSRHLKGLGVTGLPQVKWSDVLRKKNEFTAAIPENTIKNIKGNGAEYFAGKAAFWDAHTITIENERISGENIVVAVGAKPMTLPFDGHEHLISSDEFLELESLPGRIVFIGGGFISFEFAHFSARLGEDNCEIYILEASDRVLGPFDEDLVESLVESSEKDGITIKTGVAVKAVRKNKDSYEVILGTGEKILCDLVVHGAGRRANLEGMNLEAAAVDYSARGIKVDSQMRSSSSSVFAVGDCVDSVQLARVGDMEGHIAAQTILSSKDGTTPSSADYSCVASLLFTYPQLGMVGKTEAQLKKEGVKYWRSFQQNLSWPTYRRIGMKYAAYKILVDEAGKILGVHMLSDNASGVINTFRLAMIEDKNVNEVYKNSILSPYPSRESDIVYMLGDLLD